MNPADSPITLGVVLGSTRPGGRGASVASWLLEAGAAHLERAQANAALALLDVAEFELPLLDEPVPASFGEYEGAHTRCWAAAVDACDGFVFVTPEYNHSTSAALKNAIDFVFAEWHDKAAGLVGYGVTGGVRAVEHLRQVLAELRIADVRTTVNLTLGDDFAERTAAPRPRQSDQLATMLDEVVSWSRALRAVRDRPSITVSR
jgi:NAD(P)H-dependent FMN reductase